jgi:acetolactate synthase-1/2/3 large subunit
MLCLHADLASAACSGEGEPAVVSEPVRRPACQPAEVDAVLHRLATARRPLVLAGLGAWRSGAAKVLQDLAARVGGLLTTTAMANGLFGDSRWSIGVCGGFASPVAADLIGQADLVLAFGASLDALTLHGGRLIDPAATVIRVDSGPQREVARVNLEIEADATDAATALLDAIDAAELVRTDWRDVAEPMLAGVGWAQEPYTDVSTTERIDPRTLSLELAGIPPAERTVVLDGGHFIAWPFMYWSMPDPAATIFIGSAFQTIGLGFAGAVAGRDRVPRHGFRRGGRRVRGPGRHGTHRRRPFGVARMVRGRHAGNAGTRLQDRSRGGRAIPGGAAGGRGSASEETAGPVTGNHNRQAITGSACPDFERTFNDRDS